MSKKKVLHLYPRLNISCGVTNSIKLIAKNSTRYHHSILTFGGNSVSDIREICEVIQIKGENSKSIIDFIHNLISLLKVCKQGNYSILHSHHRYFDLLSFFISKIIKIHTVTTVRSIVGGHKYLSYKSNELVAISQFVKKHLTDYYRIDKEKIRVVHNFFDSDSVKINKSAEDIKKELAIENNKIVFGYFGRIDFKEKSTDILIKLFNKIILQYDNIILLLIGDGDEFHKAKRLIFDNKKIILIPAKKNIHNYYQILDCFILPSISEPFGNVLLEAAYHKIPIIANECGGIPEILKTDGILFNKNDFSDLENKIIQFVNHKISYKNTTETLYQRVLNEFDAELKICELEKIYEFK